MAGDWIKLEHATLDKPEVLELSELLSMSHGDALLLCLRFWVWGDQQSHDGRLIGRSECRSTGVSKHSLDALMRCPGFANALIHVGWMDENGGVLTIVNFDRHNGKNAKNRVLKNRAQSDWRNGKGANVDGRVDAHVDKSRSTKASTREEKRREELKELTTLSGKPDVASLPVNGYRHTAGEILEFLNEKAHRHYELVDANLEPIIARLKEGSTADDIRAVVAMKCREWNGNEDMAKYLRPETLFGRRKFAGYKGQLHEVS